MFALTEVVPDFTPSLQCNSEYTESHGKLGKMRASKSGWPDFKYLPEEGLPLLNVFLISLCSFRQLPG
jgi:hypothetical protein